MVSGHVLLLVARPWSIVLGGDLMLNQIPLKTNPLASVRGFLQSGSVALANLESPLTKERKATPHKSAAEIKARDQFLLKADPSFARQIATAGIRMVGLANNHCMDYRGNGLAEMTRALKGSSIAWAGAGNSANQAAKVGVFSLPDGTRIGLYSALAFVGEGALKKCTPATLSSPGINVLNLSGRIDGKARKKLSAIVDHAKKECDFLVIGLHWGIERNSVPTAYQVQLGRALIDAGADIVWGSHPHVLQGAEIYNGKPIFYSLGNIVSAMPANTALVKLTYNGAQLRGSRAFNCKIAGGKVLPMAKDPQTMTSLSKLLLRKYPNIRSIAWKPTS